MFEAERYSRLRVVVATKVLVWLLPDALFNRYFVKRKSPHDAPTFFPTSEVNA